MPPRSITYRDLRNTPARVFEPLTLLADGSGKALLIPIRIGNSIGVAGTEARGPLRREHRGAGFGATETAPVQLAR